LFSASWMNPSSSTVKVVFASVVIAFSCVRCDVKH
jgi:hypothetical protein